MRLRGGGPADVPEQLLHYMPANRTSARAWREARRRPVAEYPPASLAALNAFYAPGVVLPPRADPRKSA